MCIYLYHGTVPTLEIISSLQRMGERERCKVWTISCQKHIDKMYTSGSQEVFEDTILRGNQQIRLNI